MIRFYIIGDYKIFYIPIYRTYKIKIAIWKMHHYGDNSDTLISEETF